MTRNRKKRKNKNGLSILAKVLFSLAIVIKLAASLFIGSLDASLTMEIQEINNKISTLKAENESLSISISSLENKERVYIIALEEGLEQNQDNIISLQGNK